MASGRNERRMVFDIRGRRRHVVKFVYAILALLMGASLFLVVGPVNIGSLLGTSRGTSSAASGLEEQAARVEHRLLKSPEDPDLLLSLTRARPEQFRKTSLKRHNPETTRKNTSGGYYGCLQVDVKRSCVLYRKIEGWASAVTRVAAAPD